MRVTNTPPGQIPLGGPGQQNGSAHQAGSNNQAEIFRLPSNLSLSEIDNSNTVVDNENFKDLVQANQQNTQGAGSRIVISTGIDATFSAQIGEILDLAGDSWVILMPSDFPSYLGSDHELVSTELYNALTNRFGVSWGVEKASKSVWVRLLQLIKLNKGKNAQVCAIFENGDSACYQVYPTSPSSADLVEGSQKDANGNPLPPASTGNSNGSGLGVSSGGGRVTYSSSNPNAGSGSWVYVTISCIRSADGKLSSCTIQYETRAN